MAMEILRNDSLPLVESQGLSLHRNVIERDGKFLTHMSLRRHGRRIWEADITLNTAPDRATALTLADRHWNNMGKCLSELVQTTRSYTEFKKRGDSDDELAVAIVQECLINNESGIERMSSIGMFPLSDQSHAIRMGVLSHEENLKAINSTKLRGCVRLDIIEHYMELVHRRLGDVQQHMEMMKNGSEDDQPEFGEGTGFNEARLRDALSYFNRTVNALSEARRRIDETWWATVADVRNGVSRNPQHAAQDVEEIKKILQEARGEWVSFEAELDNVNLDHDKERVCALMLGDTEGGVIPLLEKVADLLKPKLLQSIMDKSRSPVRQR